MASYKSKGKPKKGLYKPNNPDKYIQPQDKTMNSKEYPEYRSSWESFFYRYCDMSKAVSFWSTEYVAIPYINPLDQKQHRYFPDVFVQFEDGRKIIIEIKPHKEKFINENKRITDKMQQTYLINQAKWESAKKFSEQHGYKFVVMTEYDLFGPSGKMKK